MEDQMGRLITEEYGNRGDLDWGLVMEFFFNSKLVLLITDRQRCQNFGQ